MKTKLIPLWLVACLLFSLGAAADTVKLKNGTTIEGDVLSETATEVVVERSMAGGSIKATDRLKRDDVVEIVRATAAQKAELAMRQAYELTRRYQLDPRTSYAKDYYNQVLDRALRKFLADYPQSPFDKEMRERITAWEAERDKVADGQVKRNGQWLNAVEVATAEATQQLQQTEAALANRRYRDATQILEKLVISNAPSNLVATATELRVTTYQQWLQSLQQDKAQWEQLLATCATNMAAAQKKLQEARAAVGAATRGQGFSKSGAGSSKMGHISNAVQGPMKAEADAKNVVAALEQQQVDLSTKLYAINQELPKIQARITELGIRTLPLIPTAPTTTVVVASTVVTTEVAKVEPPPTRTKSSTPPPIAPPAEDGDLVTSLITLAKKYWLFGVLGVLALVWVVSRKMGQ